LTTIRDLSASYAEGRQSPVKVTEDLLAKVEKLNPAIDCYITILKESALAEAEIAETLFKEGKSIGFLQGIPLAIKDIVYIKGVRCTAGSKILESNLAPYDSPVARRLKSQGAVILGTTNLHEFACGVTNVNPHYGATRNPWDLDRIPGGSSGGSAASVSAGMSVAAVGTDTAGSVRIPASLCGVVGLKPTYGRISRVGVVPLSSSFDTVGTLTGCTWDAAVMLQALAGPEQGDMTTADIGVPNYLEDVDRLGEKKVGVPRRFIEGRVTGGVMSTFESYLSDLSRLGCDVVDLEVEAFEEAAQVFFPIRRAEASAFHQKWLAEHPEMYGRDVREKLEDGRRILAVDYVNAQNRRPELRQRLIESMGEADFLATPTTSVVAPRIGQESVEILGKGVDVYTALVEMTLPASLVGFPALSIPVGHSEGLPVGAQLMARPYDESGLLAIANAYEKTVGRFPEPKAIAVPSA